MYYLRCFFSLLDIFCFLTHVVLFEMLFRDLAELVEKQSEKIGEIAVSADKSHERAQAGLVQVNQASQHQPGICTIC